MIDEIMVICFCYNDVAFIIQFHLSHIFGFSLQFPLRHVIRRGTVNSSSIANINVSGSIGKQTYAGLVIIKER